MLAAVPAPVTEVAAWIGAITVIVGGCTAIFTRKPFRWFGRKLVSEPFGGWVRRQIETSATGKSVAHHLGPNGDTVPMHSRVARLEVVALLDEGLRTFHDEVEAIREEDLILVRPGRTCRPYLHSGSIGGRHYRPGRRHRPEQWKGPAGRSGRCRTGRGRRSRRTSVRGP